MASLIASIYSAFADVTAPRHAVVPAHCFECEEYDRCLHGVLREALPVEAIGTICWGPIPHLTPAGMAYFLPRFMELALLGSRNKDGDPFVCQFLLQVARYGRSAPQFASLSGPQVEAFRACLRAIQSAFGDEIEEHFYGDALAEALVGWQI